MVSLSSSRVSSITHAILSLSLSRHSLNFLFIRPVLIQDILLIILFKPSVRSFVVLAVLVLDPPRILDLYSLLSLSVAVVGLGFGWLLLVAALRLNSLRMLRLRKDS